MWKTLGGFWANLRPLGNILPSKNAQIHCGAVGLFFFRKPSVDQPPNPIMSTVAVAAATKLMKEDGLVASI
jgi:hypothetical protein